jgi:hypothetical protein
MDSYIMHFISFILNEIKRFSIVVSSIIIVIGWYVNGAQNRRSEIAKKLLELRLPTLIAIREFKDFIFVNNQHPNDVEFVRRANKIGNDLQLYGKNDEIQLFDKFTESWQTQNEKEALTALNSLITLATDKIRKELNLKSIKKLKKVAN